MTSLNRVEGRITLAGTSLGIPDLVVSAFDIEPRQTLDRDPAPSPEGERLGSSATNRDGHFVIEYDDRAFCRAGQESRPDLVLLVTAPEVAGADPCPAILHVTCTVRRNAGRLETYRLQLTPSALVKAGIAIPTAAATHEPESSAGVLAQIASASNLDLALGSGVREIARQRVERRRELKAAFETKVEGPFLGAISRIPTSIRDQGRLVAADESAEQASIDNVRREILDVVNASDPALRAPVRGHLVLTEEVKARLAEFENEKGDFEGVPAEVIEPALFGGDGQPGSGLLLRKELLNDPCRPRTPEEECAEGALQPPSAPRPLVPGPILLGPGIAATQKDDIPLLVAKALDGFVSAEEPLRFGGVDCKHRADQQALDEVIGTLALHKGPADTAAFYDFHDLQIAFDHVWQEAIDQGVLDLAEEAYGQIVEAGGATDPFAVPGMIIDPVLAFESEADLTAEAHDVPPPALVIKMFEVKREQWNALNEMHRNELALLAAQMVQIIEQLTEAAGQKQLLRDFFDDPDSIIEIFEKIKELKQDGIELVLGAKRAKLLHLRAMGNRILHYADEELVAGQADFSRLHTTLRDLRKRLARGHYAFTVYAANSVNFGIFLRYQQKWDPIAYQAGPLKKSLPLAPKETRRYSIRKMKRTKRSEREVNRSLQSRREEAEEQTRAESEIVRHAQAKTNFDMSAEGGVSFEVFKVGGARKLSTEAAKSSNDVKKAFHQAVRKAAHEYRAERETVITTESEEEFAEEVSGEVSNPNDELAVTFLFYELQRRFRVSEHLQSVVPVVLVAQEVPAPDEIDEDWILTYDWILRRVILDDSFVPALDYVCNKVVGDEVALNELKKNVNQQRRLVTDLKEELTVIRRQVAQRYAALQRSIERRAAEIGSGGGVLDALPGGGLVGTATQFLFGGGKDTDAEAALVREEAARDAYQREEREERDLMARLEREVSSLNLLTESYSKALSEHLNRRTQIERAKLHFQENILHYMQAIWSHEPRDERLFRLHEVPVPVLKAKSRLYAISGRPTFAPAFARPELSAAVHGFEVSTEIDPDFQTRPLVEVADLDSPLGFIGNYIIFPLHESNALTDFMIAPYRDPDIGLHDPDLFGNWTVQDFARYVCCLEERLEPQEFAAVRDSLREQYQRLRAAQVDDQEIVVPTGSLFIEALPAAHPILEDFKLVHRALDVKKAQENVREAQLENIRLAARLLHDQFEDPNVERKITIEGNPGGVVVPSGDT